MTTPGLIMVGSYDHRLVALSVLISILAAYATLNLAERVMAERGGARLLWLIAGAGGGRAWLGASRCCPGAPSLIPSVDMSTPSRFPPGCPIRLQPSSAGTDPAKAQCHVVQTTRRKLTMLLHKNPISGDSVRSSNDARLNMTQESKASTLRILIVDDYELLRRGVRALIESHAGWEVCGEAATGREAVEEAKKLKPEVVVMDIGMPELNGLDATRQILKAAPRTEVLILAAHESEQLVREVLQAGAHGYVLKSAAGRDLANAIEALSRHEAFFTSSVAKLVLQSYHKKGSQDERPRSLLSPREREIIQLLAEGKSNNEIAEMLYISGKTVETHRAHIMEKLNLHSIAELVRYAIRNKIVEP